MLGAILLGSILGLIFGLNIGLNIGFNIRVQYWVVPMNLHLKFHQNRVSNSWDIANIEFVWVGGGGVVCKVIFVFNPT